MHNLSRVHVLVPNTLQISFSSGSPALSDRSRFRKYFRNSPDSGIVAPTLRSTTSHFGWTRVAVITQEEALFTIVSSILALNLYKWTYQITIIIIIICALQYEQLWLSERL